MPRSLLNYKKPKPLSLLTCNRSMLPPSTIWRRDKLLKSKIRRLNMPKALNCYKISSLPSLQPSRPKTPRNSKTYNPKTPREFKTNSYRTLQRSLTKIPNITSLSLTSNRLTLLTFKLSSSSIKLWSMTWPPLTLKRFKNLSNVTTALTLTYRPKTDLTLILSNQLTINLSRTSRHRISTTCNRLKSSTPPLWKAFSLRIGRTLTKPLRISRHAILLTSLTLTDFKSNIVRS